MTDPSIWIGLATLVVLEIVLGIDNLIFIAILADKLPPKQRDKARIVGLTLALLMRLGLLSVMSWLITLTNPVFSIGPLSLSARGLILLFGGIFLLLKATLELHERLEDMPHVEGDKPAAGFWMVVTQIVVLDAVFSMDAVITAVGMVEHLGVMMAAVVIAVAVMLLASRPLTRFVNAHPTVVVLCLSFLLMIGLSLVAEGIGFHIPKGYLYAAIGFSVVIEFFNQVARRNFLRHEARRPMRERTADAVLRLLGAGRRSHDERQAEALPAELLTSEFAQEERNMVSGVLSLAERSVRSVMTPRADLSWVNLDDDAATIRKLVLTAPHSFFPVCRGELDNLVGVARGKDLLGDLHDFAAVDEVSSIRPPIIVHESIGMLALIDTLRDCRGQLVLVTDEYGALAGVVTPVDILEAIAGEFPDEDESLAIAAKGHGCWRMEGVADLRAVAQVLNLDPGWAGSVGNISTLGGLLLQHFGIVPAPQAALELEGYLFTVEKVSERRIEQVEVRRIAPKNEGKPGTGSTGV